MVGFQKGNLIKLSEIHYKNVTYKSTKFDIARLTENWSMMKQSKYRYLYFMECEVCFQNSTKYSLLIP